MANKSPRWQQTSRDRDILAALDLCPLEAKDLLALSQTFAQPFGSLDRVRRTLKRLQAAGQVQAWRYAVVGDSGGAAPLYYKLTLDGYRTLHQDADAVPPTKRYLSELSVARHQHQRHLTKYIVQTHVAAHRHGLRIVDSHAENTYRIETPLGPLFPDRRFTIVSPTGSRFTNCIELDNSTESLVSSTSVDSIELKIKKYLHDLAACDYAYRVQFVVTRSSRRAQHIRQLVMGATASSFKQQEQTMANKRPEKVFRVGFVSASIFTHDVESDDGKRTMRSVSLQKRYLDGQEAKFTSSFNLAELPQAIRCLELAQQYVEGREAEVKLDD